MKSKTIMEIIIDDMEHRVRKIIYEHNNDAGFPRLEDYGVTEDEFDDYMFYKQAVIDNAESLRKKYTIYSIIFLIPFIVAAFFKTTLSNALMACGCGLVLCAIYYIVTILIQKWKMSHLNNESIERYIADVMKFQDR